jgi:hypothetical protein
MSATRVTYAFHRALAAFLAMSDRRFWLSFKALACPPLDAPSFERAEAAALTAGSTVGSSGGGSAVLFLALRGIETQGTAEVRISHAAMPH